MVKIVKYTRKWQGTPDGKTIHGIGVVLCELPEEEVNNDPMWDWNTEVLALTEWVDGEDFVWHYPFDDGLFIKDTQILSSVTIE